MSGELLSATIKQSNLSEWVASIKSIADECKLDVSEDGLHAAVVDPGNVAYIDTTLSPASFESYSFNGDEPAVFGLSLSKFSNAVGVAGSNDLVQITLEDQHRMEIDAGGVGFSQAGINPDTIRERPEFPDLEYDAAVERVPVSTLNRGVKATDMVSDRVYFGVDSENGGVRMYGEGDTDDAELDLMVDDVGLSSDADVEALMSLDYMKDLVRGLPSDTTVTLHLRSDFPMMIEYAADDYYASGQMFLAPRIESD